MIRSRSWNFVRPLGAIAFAFVALQASSCPSDEPTGSSSDASGTYAFTQIVQGEDSCDPRVSAGCTIQNTGDNEIVVKTGTLTLSSDHSFNLAVTGTQNGISNDHLAALAGTWAETDTGVRFSAVGVPLAINASRTSVANPLVFVVPGQTFSSSQAGVTVVFTK